MQETKLHGPMSDWFSDPLSVCALFVGRGCQVEERLVT